MKRCVRCDRTYSGSYATHRLTKDHEMAIAEKKPHAFRESPSVTYCLTCGEGRDDARHGEVSR